ncbi:WD repeat domain phosphoinositide-interacting protein 3 [Smittium culicis]|uniref:WD repeat domain phosphoinositide-interacting protein 3 n=2 Tax=Smittium culicis TaxID=133412 RepID=A0A1R1XW28_9FUNG|nr:WD repeat domain phosphoinositide-interacting protein 3 [Smittium culicis]
MDLSLPENKSSKDNSDSQCSDLLYADFNQDYGCFSIGTESGFKIFNSDPFKQKMQTDFGAGIGNVTMLYRSNLLALVGGGKNPQFPPNKVMLWDDSTQKVTSELEFRASVVNVLLRKDLIIVCLRSKIIACTFEPKPVKLHAFETYDNPKGIASLSTDSSNAVLVFPGRQKGQIQVVELNTLAASSPISPPQSTSPSSPTAAISNSYPEIVKQAMKPANINIIVAHTSPLSALSVSSDGTIVASASEKGTLIRVFSTSGGGVLFLSFCSDATRLCVSSDKGTVHIFNLEGDRNSTNNSSDQSAVAHNRGNRQSSLSFLKGILPKYFSSEWSFAHFRIQSEVRCICGFTPNKDSVIVICANGVCEKYSVGGIEGKCTREWSRRFV